MNTNMSMNISTGAHRLSRKVPVLKSMAQDSLGVR
jgi:hypothetical protein